MKIVVVGGVAAGASAATRARRMDDSAEIVIFEMGEYVSFANCGLPYYVGGEIEDREDLLLVSPELFRDRFNIAVKTRHEVTAINRDRHTVTVCSDGREFEESYDKLILAQGCRPIELPIGGTDLDNVCNVFTISDVDKIVATIDAGISEAVVIGTGFIGLETTEALAHRGIATTLIGIDSQLMRGYDPEFSLPLEQQLQDAGVSLLLNSSVTKICGSQRVEGVQLDDGTVIAAQLVIVAAGVRARVELAVAAGLPLGESGGVAVNASMQTADADIYAAGDMVENVHIVTGSAVRMPLAGNANKQGRVAGTNAVGGNMRFRGVLGTSAIKVFDLTAARTGLSEFEAEQYGFDYYSVYVPAASHASYYPGAGRIILKITVEKQTGRILGAQGIGESGVDKRIDVLATAIYAGLTVEDLENLDLAYAPPYSSAKDPVIIGGMIASNVMRGDLRTITPRELDEFIAKHDAQLVDVRSPEEWEEGIIDGALMITIEQLRANPDSLEKGRTYVVYCGVGYRAYVVCRFLTQQGYDVYNLTGGYSAYAMEL